MNSYKPKYPRGTRTRFLLSRSFLLFLVFTLAGAGSLNAAYRCSGDCLIALHQVEPAASMPCCAPVQAASAADRGHPDCTPGGSGSYCLGHLDCSAEVNPAQDMLRTAPAPDLVGQITANQSHLSAEPANPLVVLLSSYRRPPPLNFPPLHIRHCVLLI